MTRHNKYNAKKRGEIEGVVVGNRLVWTWLMQTVFNITFKFADAVVFN